MRLLWAFYYSGLGVSRTKKAAQGGGIKAHESPSCQQEAQESKTDISDGDLDKIAKALMPEGQWSRDILQYCQIEGTQTNAKRSFDALVPREVEIRSLETVAGLMGDGKEGQVKRTREALFVLTWHEARRSSHSSRCIRSWSRQARRSLGRAESCMYVGIETGLSKTNRDPT